MKLILFIIFWSLPLSYQADLLNKKEIIWAIAEFPPGFIMNGPKKGQGYADKLTRFMMENLTEFDHSIYIYPNWARLRHELRESKNKTICNAAFFYRDVEERKKVAKNQLFTAPSFVFFLHDIIVKKSKRHLYKEIESLEELLQNQDLTFGYSRSTGPITSTILGNYLGLNLDISSIDVRDRLSALGKKKNILIRLGTDTVAGPMQMLMKERIDYILEYEFMIDFESERLGLKDQFVAIPVKETYEQVSLAAYSCSNTQIGNEAVDMMNKLLIKYRDTEEYKNILSYLVPKTKERQERYWQEHKKILDILQ